MAAVDAQFYWMSAKVPNDDFMIYAFDREPADLDRAIEQVLKRARACPDLTMRVEDRGALTYPKWVHADVGPEQVVRHDLADHTWQGFLAAVMGLADGQLDIRRMPWRLHVFSSVRGIPGVAGDGAAAVLQVPHALADGVRATAMAAWLFGRAVPVPEASRLPTGFLPWRAAAAARAHRRLVRDTEAGLLTPGLGTRPRLATNAPPEGDRLARTLVRHRSQVPGPTVTVGVLSAVSEALSGLFGGSAGSLGAEVPMAKPGVPRAQNHFGNVVVGLYPELGREARAERIATDLANGRRRFEHPASRASDRALAAFPAPVLRWGVSLFDPDVRPEQVYGNTVVSSNNRGPADLRFGGARVVLSASFPALSSAMGLSHGVHGVGDTIAISVHATASAFSDIDAYVELLDAALR
jgi:Wax ester synthase-like Acyl-CoA acyltransferase domain/WS/DGAT C-terminal domain